MISTEAGEDEDHNPPPGAKSRHLGAIAPSTVNLKLKMAIKQKSLAVAENVTTSTGTPDSVNAGTNHVYGETHAKS